MSNSEQLTFTLAQRSNRCGTPVDNYLHTVDGAVGWLTADNLTSAAMTGKDITFRLVNDGTHVTFYADNIALAYMDTAVFQQYNSTAFIGVGTADNWIEAASADVVIKI